MQLARDTTGIPTLGFQNNPVSYGITVGHPGHALRDWSIWPSSCKRSYDWKVSIKESLHPNLTSRNSVRPQPRTGLMPKLYNVLERGEDKLWDEWTFCWQVSCWVCEGLPLFRIGQRSNFIFSGEGLPQSHFERTPYQAFARVLRCNFGFFSFFDLDEGEDSRTLQPLRVFRQITSIHWDWGAVDT